MVDDLTTMTWRVIWSVCQKEDVKEFARALANEYDSMEEESRKRTGISLPSSLRELAIVSEFMTHFEMKYSRKSAIERNFGKHGYYEGYRFKEGISIVHISKSNPDKRGFDKVSISGEYVPAQEIYNWLFNEDRQ